MTTIRDIVSDIDDVNVCKSYLLSEPEEFTEYLQNNNPRMVSIVSMNIRSINCNLNKFLVLLTRMSISMDILVFSECWLSEKYVPQQITGYKVFYTTNKINQNDGVVVYVKNSLKQVKVHEEKFEDGNCILIKIAKELCVVALYRPHTNVTNFLKSLNKTLKKLRSFPNIVVTGDINIKIKTDNEVNEKIANEYLLMLASHSILPGHTFHTREQSCLDHCMIKTKNTATTIVLPASETDHSPITVQISTKKSVNKQINNKYTFIDYEAIKEALSHVNWDDLIDYSNLEEATEIFIATITSLIEKFSTIRTIPKSKVNIKPWITPGLIKCMRQRDRLHRNSKKEPNNANLKKIYINYRNVCNKILKKTKRNYERTELLKHSKDSKKTWDTIKKICNFPKKENPVEQLLNINKCKNETLNSINEYFINVGSKLAKQTLLSLNETEQELAAKQDKTYSPTSSFGLLPTDATEIINIVKTLKNTSAAGWDNINAKLLKTILPHIIVPLTTIFQASFDTGIFPSALKKSIVCPIYKNGNEDIISNYRPISLLPTFSKLLEKLMNVRLKKYLETKNLLSVNQYGFRNGKSTEDAVLAVTEHIKERLDSKDKIVGIFIDLAKAFDTVSIPILLAKIEAMGIRGIPLKWFESYLSGRLQAVRIENTVSQQNSVNFGVPQGSILGPTLFLIYINQLCDMDLKSGNIVTYADDTVIMFQNRTWEKLEETANHGLEKISNWLRQNLLTINIQKTYYMPFTINRSTQPKTELKLKIHKSTCEDSQQCQCENIKPTNVIKYLGVTLDKNLIWKEHIQNISGRVRKLIMTFKELRHVLSFTAIRRIYYALAESVLTYCIPAWGSAAKTHLEQLEISQRALLKVMTFKCRRFSTTNLYKECEVLTIRQLFIKSVIMKQHKLLSNNVKEKVLTKRRKDQVFKLSRTRTKFGSMTVKNLGPLLYNQLCEKANLTKCTKSEFYSNLKNHLLTLDYDKTEKLLEIEK